MIVVSPLSRGAWLALSFAALTCAVPALLGIHVLPLSSFYEEWLAAAFGTVACAAALLAVRHRPVAIPHTALPMFGLLGVLALQLALGKVAYTQQSTLGMLYTVFAMAMVWCGFQLNKIAGLERSSRVVASALLAGGVLNTVLVCIQAYAPSSPIAALTSPLVSPRAYGNLNQANLLGDQLALAAASLLYLHAIGVLRLGSTVALGIIIATGLTLSGSRSVWLYGTWLLTWTTYLRLRSGDSRYGQTVLGLVAGLVALATLAYALPPASVPGGGAPISSGLERLANINIEAGRTGLEGVRLYFWQQAWEMFKSAPVLGVGFGQFAYEFLQQSVRFADVGIPGQERNAHNIVLQLLAETGLAGTLFVAIALGLWFWRAVRADANYERWWVVAAAGIVLLHSMVEYPLWYAHFLGPFALLLGLGETRVATLQRVRIVVPALASVIGVGMLALASLLYNFTELRRWIYLVPEQALRDPAIVERQALTVRRLQPTLFGPYVDLPLASTVRIDAEELDAKLAFNGRVMAFSPIAPVVLRQVVFLSLAGREAEAKKLLDAGAVLYPDELAPFAADLDRLGARGLPVSALATYLAEKHGKN